jgi:hypothetical protein
MPFDAADIAAFFDEDMPGYAIGTFSFGDVDGLFRDNTVEMMGIVEGRELSFTCAASDLQNVVRGTAVTILGTSYKVKSPPRKNGSTGNTVIDLELAE